MNHILQITIQESSKLLSDAANLNKNNFEEMLSSLPVSTHNRSTEVLSLFTYTMNSLFYVSTRLPGN